jgi:hypothetical protein
MKIYVIVLAGVAGTALMTAFGYLFATIIDGRLKVVKVLGTMLTNQTTANKGLSESRRAIITGTIVHYAVGIGFALLYNWLWQKGIGTPGIFSGILFGFVNGIIAVTIWKIFIVLHPNPPLLPIKLYLFYILIGHLFYAEGVVLFFHWLS